MAFVGGKVEEPELYPIEVSGVVEEAHSEAVLLAFDVVEGTEGEAPQRT